jgi:hypothetical protein
MMETIEASQPCAHFHMGRAGTKGKLASAPSLPRDRSPPTEQSNKKIGKAWD